MKHNRSVRAVLIAVLLTLNTFDHVKPAFAGTQARTLAQTTAASGDWSQIIRTIGSGTQSGKVGLGRALTANAGAVYNRTLELANVGSLDLVSTAITVTITRTSGIGAPTVKGVYVGCRNGTWNTATTPVCSGTTVALGTFSGAVNSYTTVVTTLAMAGGTAIPIRLAMTSTVTGTFVFTASVSVNRARVRLAQVLTA